MRWRRPPDESADTDSSPQRGRPELIAHLAEKVPHLPRSPRLVNRARRLTEDHPQTLRLEVMDAREGLPDGPFDLVVCLYDVLGSSADPHDDIRIVRNIRNRTGPEGRAVISVMNSAATVARLPDDHAPADEQEFISALESLAPSTAMESSGDIFDPELVVYDGVHYRKEQSSSPAGTSPPNSWYATAATRPTS